MSRPAPTTPVPDLDETDREILRLLLEDGRRPYSDIAEVVDLSAPAVSDRVEKLRELGVVRSFTVDVDRSLLQADTHVLVRLSVAPGRAGGVRERLADDGAVEHVFETADGDVVYTAQLSGAGVTDHLADAVDDAFDAVADVEVDLLSAAEWSPSLGETDLALSCVECGTRVGDGGRRETFDGRTYHFCCPTCASAFEARRERIAEDA